VEGGVREHRVEGFLERQVAGVSVHELVVGVVRARFREHRLGAVDTDDLCPESAIASVR